MSWRATAYVKAIRTGLKQSEKFMLLTLADYHNDETGRCDASVKTLAADCLMTRRAAQLLLRSLERKGFVDTKSRLSGNGRTMTNQYDLTFRKPPEEGEGEIYSPLPEEGGRANGGSPYEGEQITPQGERTIALRGRTVDRPNRKEPSLEPAPANRESMDAPSLHLPSNVSASSDQPREIFISPGPEEALEIPEPDWSAGDLPAGLRLVSSRFCDDCGEAFVQVMSETICPACVERFVAAARRK